MMGAKRIGGAEVDAEQTLRNVPLFAELQPKQVRQLAKWATTRNYQAGQVIVAEGQAGLGLYCIQSGKVSVTQKTNTGEREIRQMGPGESFGELALLSNAPRAATVTAMDPTTCVLLDKSQFLAEIRTYPEIALALLPVLTQWVREADKKIAELS
jgi:CRP/FNR family cyclic AMP-dependent transcriptional regulator